MLSFFKNYKKFALVLGLISVIVLALIYNTLNTYKPLAIYAPALVNTELVDSTIQHKKKYHKISDFSLTNQNGETITQNDYKNKIYVADFFFTTCKTICPIMTKNMAYIQKEILHDDDVLLLSHSVIPEIDTIAQLKRYALKNGLNDEKWNLVTGDKQQIYELARKSYLAVKEDLNSEPLAMIHTENFILIDKKRQIRGFYDGTSKADIGKLIADINHLKKEYNR